MGDSRVGGEGAAGRGGGGGSSDYPTIRNSQLRKMVKRVFKYGTGDVVPEGAVYLRTITQDAYADEWLVWHYFLVEVEE